MLKKPTLVGKTEYDGPKSFNQIVKKIKEELKYPIREEFIEDVIKMALSGRSLQSIVKTRDKFRLRGIGRFYMKIARRKEIMKEKEERAKPKKENRSPKAKKNKIKYQNRWLRRRAIRRRWEKLNERRAKVNLKPLPLWEFLKFQYPKNLKDKKFILKELAK